jgi:hypothetical protein
MESLVEKLKVDFFYSIRYGTMAPLPSNVKTGVHAVFQAYEPHGTKYAYVSEWLANYIQSQTGQTSDFVPHIVELPLPNACLRSAWNIPKTAKVIGRHGGFKEFDITWVKQEVANVLEKRLDYYFVFVNTEKWIEHPRVKFLNGIVDLQEKSNFINSCDAMLHARERGESFGLSIAEWLFHNKPVLAWKGGIDQNHLKLLENSNLLYESPEDLSLLLNNFYLFDELWCTRVALFNPYQVMQRFKKVFLS